MIDNEELYIKPSRNRMVAKVDREVHIKDRVPKHTPYKRVNKNFKQDVLKGVLRDDEDE
jgi:hypothetical protein